MRIADFALERFFARWEFAVRHLLCASDVEGWPMADLLALADDETAGALGEPPARLLGGARPSAAPRRDRRRSTTTSTPDDVLVFAGAEEAIFCLSNVLLGPGDHAVVTWPGYQSLYEVGRATGADVTLHVLHEADGWALDPDRLIATPPPGDAARRRQRAAQPDGHAADARRVGAARPASWPIAGSTSSPTRSTASSSSTRPTA